MYSPTCKNFISLAAAGCHSLDVKVPLGAGLRPQDPEPLVGDEDGLVDAQDVRVATSNPGNLKQCLEFFHLLLKTRTYFSVCLIDGTARIFFLHPMPRPGIKLTSVQLHLF